MTKKIEDPRDKILRYLKDLDELERETRRFHSAEPWLIDEINKRRFDLTSQLNRIKYGDI